MNKNAISETEAAAFIGVCPQTLRNWRKAGKCPKYFTTPSGRVRYSSEEILKFIDHPQFRSNENNELISG